MRSRAMSASEVTRMQLLVTRPAARGGSLRAGRLANLGALRIGTKLRRGDRDEALLYLQPVDLVERMVGAGAGVQNGQSFQHDAAPQQSRQHSDEAQSLTCDLHNRHGS